VNKRKRKNPVKRRLPDPVKRRLKAILKKRGWPKKEIDSAIEELWPDE